MYYDKPMEVKGTHQKIITRLAKVLRWVSLGTIAGVLAVRVYAIAVPGNHFVVQRLPESLLEHPVIVNVLTWSVVLLVCYGLLRMTQLARLYEKGQIFSLATAKHWRVIALCLLLKAILRVAAPVLSALFTPGEFNLILESSDYWDLLVAGLFYLIAQIMTQAQLLAEDNEQIV